MPVFCVADIPFLVHRSIYYSCKNVLRLLLGQGEDMKEEKEQTPISHISDEELKRIAVELMEKFDESFKELAK